MPYSSGTFSRVHDFTSDRDAGIKIQASRTDAEFDGIATALSTAILKDGTQTTTAVVPFAFGISIVDNKAITLGTNSDITIQYDETTNDSLEIAAAVEGAALGIVLKSDQGDDNADQHKLSIADGGTLTLGSKISGSFVSYLTHTPNATVASSTTAIGGNLTVGGDLTVTGDDITMGTNTAGHLLIADGTNFNSVGVGSLSEISTVANDDVFLAVDTSGGGLKKITRSTIVAGLAVSGSGISNVVEDTTPQLGGDLDVNGNGLVSTSNGNIALTPNGTGVVRIDGTNGIDMQSGGISIKNSGSESYIRFYCESSNAHYVQLQAPAHADFSGNHTVTLPNLASTVATTSLTETLTNKTLTTPVIAEITSGSTITLNATTDIVLDADGDEVIFKDGSTNVGHVSMDSDNLTIKSLVSDKDIIFQGNDGGSDVTALTLDMSAAGAATFNDKIIATELDISGNIDVDGTANLDVVDIDGAVDMASSLTVGGAFTSVGIDDNADATTMTIDTSENVGIGNTSPSSQYMTRLVVGDGSGTEGITIYSGNDSSGRLEFSDATSGDGRYAGGIVYEHNNNKLRFNTNGGNERMSIDSNGAVTMPKQPRLSVYQFSAQTISHNTYTKLKLDGTDSITNGFTGWTQSNTHTRWTTATAGTYRIHASMRWYTNSAISTSLMDIYLNGSRITFGYDHTLDNYSQLHAMTIHDLSANDYLEVVVYQYSGGDVAMNGGSANLVRLTADLIA